MGGGIALLEGFTDEDVWTSTIYLTKYGFQYVFLIL